MYYNKKLNWSKYTLWVKYWSKLHKTLFFTACVSFWWWCLPCALYTAHLTHYRHLPPTYIEVFTVLSLMAIILTTDRMNFKCDKERSPTHFKYEYDMIGVSGRRQSLYTSTPWDLTLKLDCTKLYKQHM